MVNQKRGKVAKQSRRFLIVVVLAGVCNLQGCATSIETFGLGVGAGVVGGLALLGCAIGCR